MNVRKLLLHFGGMRRIAQIGFGIFLCCLTAGMALAQVRNSTITGSVTDQTGARIPRASVTITNQDTNSTVKALSDAAGDYSVPYLPQGRYTVSIDAPGFQTFRVNNVQVATSVAIRIDAKLAAGAVSQVVTVKASSAELQTENATVSTSIGTQIINNVPNITNNPLYYATLSAGVVESAVMDNEGNLGVGVTDRQVFSAIRINGGMLGTNDIQLDGVPVQGAAWHAAAVIPNRDALQEVTVTTNNLSADLGGGQGVISLVTKSGTNEFHGDLNYTLRNEMFNANGLANDIQGIPRGKFRVNDAGGSIGGPVIIPKLFNGRNRVFFFVAFDHLSHVQPANGFETVPTDLQRQGNFSQTMVSSASGTPTPATIYNPFTAVAVPGTGDQVFQRQLYAGGIVTNPDPYGLLYLTAFPEPNHAPSDPFGDNNYYYSGSGTTNRNDLNARLDVRLGKNALYASGGLQNGTTSGINTWGNGPWYNMSWPGDITDENPYAAIGDTITLSPTTFIDLHAGVTRVATTSAYPGGSSFDAAKYTAYGMPADVQAFIADYGVAPSTYNFGYSCCLNNDMWARKNEHQTNYDFNGSITRVLGRWTLKEGADSRIYLGNWADKEWATPALTDYQECYCEQYSNRSGTSAGSPYITEPQQNGFPGAQAAIGVLGWRLDPGTTTASALAAKMLAFYSQNDWKVTPKLVLNLGLRYEIQPGPTERHNHEYDIDLTAQNPYATGLTVANASPQAQMGAIAFSGQSGYSRHLWQTEWKDVSPRLGLAYQLTNSMVVRGGLGRIYEPSNTGFNANTLVYGGAAFSGGTASTPFGTTPDGVPVGRFEDPADTEIFPAPGAVQSPALYGNGNSASGVDYFLRKGYQNAYVDQWNVFLERRFKGWLASAGYVGSKGSHLGWRQFPLNGPFNIPATQLAAWRSAWIASNGSNDPAQVQVPNPLPAMVGVAPGPIGSATISTMQSQEAYLGFLGQTVYESAGSSKYNAMQLQLQHSYANGLTAQFSYVWSRSTGISGGQTSSTYAESQQGSLAPSGGVDYTNLRNNYGLLGFDIPRRFVGAVTYELPFGSGKRFELENRFARALASGWQVGTVINLQSGYPWGPSCGGSMNGRCIPTGQPLELPKSMQHWYSGTQSVTLPDGRTVTPSEYTYLKWNPDAFTSQLVQFPNGAYGVDQYWNGTTPQYMGALRLPYFKNVNLNVSRAFKIRESVNLQVLAEATNAFNAQNFQPSAVNNANTFNPVIVADSSSNAQIGQNSNNNAGTLAPTVMTPRQITFSARLNF